MQISRSIVNGQKKIHTLPASMDVRRNFSKGAQRKKLADHFHVADNTM